MLRAVRGCLTVSAAIEEFAEVAKEFCNWAESKPAAPADEARAGIRLVANLFSKALSLAVVPVANDVAGYKVSDEQWKAVYVRFGALPFNYYLELLSPSKFDEENLAAGDLADDLADIYRDIKEGLSLYEAGYVTEAVSQWKESFGIHRGAPRI